MSSIAIRLSRRLHRYRKQLEWRIIQSLKKETIVKSRQGRLSVATQDDEISKRLYCEGEFQYDLTKNALDFLRQENLLPPKGQGTVLDIGANNGVISIGMLNDNEFEKAIGIEPGGRNVALLQTNIGLNGLSERYTVLHAAASDRRTEIFLELSDTNFGDHQVAFQSQKPQGRVEKVRALPLDDLLREAPAEAVASISLVWIDVQGHEGYVFAGGKELFSRSIPIVTELSPASIVRSGMTIEDFCALLADIRNYFWVWRRSGKFVRYPISDLPLFCEELGYGEYFDDVILTN